MMDFILNHQFAIGTIFGGICVGVGAIFGLRAALRDAIGRGLNL